MITDPQRAVHDAGLELVAAAFALNDVLLAVAEQVARVASDLEAGKTVTEAMAGVGVGQGRKRTADAIQRFEQARHKLRLASFGAAQAEGTTTAELAQVWDLPLSMVERFARQARTKSPVAE